MIKVNLLDAKTESLAKALANAVKALRSRSFSERNPQLGKMIKCQVCLRRHREPQCKPVYGVGRFDPEAKPLVAAETRRGIVGAKQFAKRRFNPHFSKWRLQLVELTKALFPQHNIYLPDPTEAMRSARKEAGRILKKKWVTDRKLKRRQQDISRRINAGLENPGTQVRPIVPRMKEGPLSDRKDKYAATKEQ